MNEATNIPTNKDISFGLESIDNAVNFYLKNKLNLKIKQDGKYIDVPVIYGQPERWKNIRKDGFIRDQRNQIQAPIIMFKRVSETKNKSIMRNIDSNSPNMFTTFQKQYTKSNTYEPFELLTNRMAKKEFLRIVVPDYLDINYKFVMWTNYISQMNELKEIISYTDGSYWGDLKTHRFLVILDNFNNTVELSDGADRIVRTNFDILLKGFILPRTIQRKANEKKSFSVASIKFEENVISDANDLQNNTDKYDKYENNTKYTTKKIDKTSKPIEQSSSNNKKIENKRLDNKKIPNNKKPNLDYKSIKERFLNNKNI